MKQLDLHGVKHNDAQILLDQFLWDNMQQNQKEVAIITGISDQMKKIVKNCVDDYMMTYEEEYNNPGKIIIKLV
jgi:DNA-nicking Smr family endonuclease